MKNILIIFLFLSGSTAYSQTTETQPIQNDSDKKPEVVEYEATSFSLDAPLVKKGEEAVVAPEITTTEKVIYREEKSEFKYKRKRKNTPKN